MTDLNEVLDADQRLDLGRAYIASGNLALADKMYDSVLDLRPANITALCDSAYVSIKTKNFTKASDRIMQALMLEPKHPHALGLAAIVYWELGNYDQAEAFFQRSLEADPTSSNTHMNYAYFCLWLRSDFERALKHYTIARDMNQLDLNARFNRSLTLMTMAESPEQWKEALEEYEIRNLMNSHGFGNLHMPIYTSYPGCTGRGSLLLVAEQGVGDVVMMARFASTFKERKIFREVYVLCAPKLEGIMSRVCGVDGVATTTDSYIVRNCDYWLPIMSCMKVLEWPTGHTSGGCLFPVNPKPMERGNKIRVGMCHAGNPDHGNDRFRSIDKDLFWGILDGLDVEAVDLKTLGSLDELQGTIESCDVVITVDTAQLHIAGSLGKPVYALIPSTPDWRWGIRDGMSGHLWYGHNVKLFRAEKPLEWQPVIKRVRMVLKQAIELRKHLK